MSRDPSAVAEDDSSAGSASTDDDSTDRTDDGSRTARGDRQNSPEDEGDTATKRRRSETRTDAPGRPQYRRAAVWLVAVGVVAAAGGVFLPTVREVLLAIGASGVFLGLLTYYLAPAGGDATLSASDVYPVLATNESAVVSELGLSEERVYVPLEDGSVRLFVPRRGGDRPDPGSLSTAFVRESDEEGDRVAADRGVAFEPTGATLRRKITDVETDGSNQGQEVSVETVAADASDALVDRFGLVEAADPAVDREAGEVTVAVTGDSLGPLDDFDHPVPSVLGVSLAAALDRPVTTAVEPAEGDREWLITCSWRVAPEGDDAGDADDADTED